MIITFPWPHPHLSPNARKGWREVAKRKKAYRSGVGWEALQAFIAAGRPQFVGLVNVSITFLPPDNIRRDLDNMLASIKAGLDAIAEITGCDDSRFRITIAKGEAVKFGRVHVDMRQAVESLELKGQIS